MTDLKDWILIVDSDDHSKKQVDICKKERPKLYGMVDCSELDNSFVDICNSVTHFPAFCHSATKSCVYGVREGEEDFVNLSKLADKVEKS